MAPRERRGGEGRERERVTHGVMLLATTMHPCTDLHGQGRESCGIGTWESLKRDQIKFVRF